MKIAIISTLFLTAALSLPEAARAGCDVCYESCGVAGKPSCSTRDAACSACNAQAQKDREAAARARMKNSPEYKAVERYDRPPLGQNASAPAQAISNCKEKSCANSAR